MDTLHERARNADAGWLEVRSDNPGAIALYEGMGYRYVATRTRYYEDGCDALVYRRSR
jgi:ribosomal-protein-alanine N-acetyltransferase